ncbi:lipoprotein-releasing system permease protein [Flavobacterium nitrogenifigens]|uniref:Lipoprotein-releasing system permease protein n=2 Tax=Flavobacterium TaxID=237 RepID=A0A7W7IWZ7_9FLAO|nr:MULTISPECIES: FtsX-like permease family protein [Flavobacterium]MBB4802133.1 lipoprotein-releasing system permease protein [Flavobacterium nitrogenifigens]MBB6387091.1 lipoprotein-releasing system permease protein [Flavobacterium notoginsengisoli]
MKLGINTEIAFAYIFGRLKQTVVAALGVTFGISMFIFMNSLITGTNQWSEEVMLSTTPHIRLYNDNELNTNEMLDRFAGDKTINLIGNPQMVADDNKITNPDELLLKLKKRKEITAISKQVDCEILYSSGNVQENGNLFGVNILEQDKMFDITSTMKAGSVKDLVNNPNGIIVGAGLADKLNLNKGDYISVTTPKMTKTLEVVGIFKTTIKNIDDTKSYTSPANVQQLLQKDRSYITDIYINIKDYYSAPQTAENIQYQTGYTAESWQSSNEQSLAGKKIRDMIANAMVITILVVAGFGIYNILNMVIYEKIKEIAILKATGFQGRDVINIFIRQALIIGVIGSIAGLLFGWVICCLVSKMYIGLGNVDYLPITFLSKHYIQGALFGMVTAFFAGYIPAVKASKVDPVLIIRG